MSGNGDAAEEPIRLALRLDDADLASRLVAILASVEGIELVDAGEEPAIAIVAAGATPAAVDPALDGLLTPRELEVLSLVSEGASNKSIARQLGISVHTAKFHVHTLIDKLDAVGRTDAVAQAARIGVIHL